MSSSQAVKPLAYTITEGDVLYISVWQEEGLSQEVTVRPDGMISFPLVGDISAAGLTIPQLRTELTAILKDYIKYPEVAVSIRKFGVGEILVLGQVNSPGVYPIEGGKTTVLDMIVKAGNFTKNADPSRVIITHRGITNAKGIATGTRVDLNRLLRNADMSQNIVLNPQDMLYVPEKKRLQ